MITDFREMIGRNRRDSFLLMCVFVVLIAVLAGAIGRAFVGNLTHALFIGGVAMVISLLISVAGFFGGADLVLSISGAKEISHDDDPQLFNIVEELSIAAGLPMPKVYLIIDPAPNAFATGRDPKHAVIAVTAGLRGKLNRDELQGVIAHEMSHIRNYDIRYSMLVAVMVGTIVMLADFFLRSLWFGGGSRRSDRDDRDNKGGGAQVVFMIIAIVLAILAPILARLIQMAVSRHREYLADASSVELTRNPLGLAHALQKIAADPDPLASANRGTQHLYIVNPLRKAGDWSSDLMATHPPIDDRVNRLLAMAHEYPSPEASPTTA
jgi:heat shock protein HtpX